MNNMKIYAFADEASGQINGQTAAMQRNGLQGLEIRGVDGQNISDISIEKAHEVRRKLDDAGLAVWSMGSPIGKIGIESDGFAAIWTSCATRLSWRTCWAQRTCACSLFICRATGLWSSGARSLTGWPDAPRGGRQRCCPLPRE